MKKMLEEFVQEYNPNGIMFDDETYDLVKVPLTPYTLWFNIWRRFRAWTPIYTLRMRLQRLFRKNGLADCDIWEAGFTMAKYQLKVIKAFKAHERHGYPGTFSEYSENEWSSREEYDKAIEEGRMIGGGFDAWEKIIDRIIAALEYHVYCDFTDEKLEWYRKHFGFAPWEKIEVNRHWKWEYKYVKGKDKWHDKPGFGCCMHFGHTPPEGNPEDFEIFKQEPMFSNHEFEEYVEAWVQEGMEMLAKYQFAMWD